jgi:hypothetical protein
MSPRAGQVPEWLVERLAAGELPEAQASELCAELGSQGTETRLAELVASNARILEELPPAAVVAEVKRRAVQGAPARRARPLFALSLAATCAAGLAVFLVVRHDHGVVPSPLGNGTQEEPETIGIRGDPLRIHRKTKAGAELLHDKSVVRKGDTLQLGYVAAGKRYGVIASIDARGTITLHLPEAPGPAAGLERGRERALPHSFELDDSPGFERFVFVTSNTPFATADVSNALKDGRALPAPLAAFELTLKKETP